MAGKWAIPNVGTSVPHCSIRKIGTADLRDVLRKGYEDFMAMPDIFGVLGMVYLIYPVTAYLLYRLTFGYDLMPLFYPLLAGFALIGPFAAFGFYELSRRRELGLEFDWRDGLRALRSPSAPSVLVVGAALAALFLLWLDAAWLIYRMTFGSFVPGSLGEFLRLLLTTKAGWALILAGNATGLVFAAVVLSISVVSFPLLLDRDVGAMAAMQTSLRVVTENPRTMALWGLIVAGALVLGMIPLFVGLAVVMPILGHATWHLYRRVVVF